MERGTVIHTSINVRGNRYGFVRTAAGEEVYFNQAGGYYALVITDDEVRFPIGWLEILETTRQHSPFPTVGQELAFVRHPRRPASDGKAAGIWMWCLSSLCVREPLPA